MRVCIGIRVCEQAEQLSQTLQSVHTNTGQATQLVLLPDGPDESTRQILSHLDVPQLQPTRPEAVRLVSTAWPRTPIRTSSFSSRVEASSGRGGSIIC